MNDRIFATLAQIGVALAAMTGFAFAPPVSGRMLLVPLSAGAAAAVPQAALDAGALLLGSGPLEGSLVVLADFDRLDPALPMKGVIIVAAPTILCGSAGESGGEG